MTNVTILLDSSVSLFYSKIAESSGRTLEQVLSDALFLLAGELSLKSLNNKNIFDEL